MLLLWLDVAVAILVEELKTLPVRVEVRLIRSVYGTYTDPVQVRMPPSTR